MLDFLFISVFNLYHDILFMKTKTQQTEEIDKVSQDISKKGFKISNKGNKL